MEHRRNVPALAYLLFSLLLVVCLPVLAMSSVTETFQQTEIPLTGYGTINGIYYDNFDDAASGWGTCNQSDTIQQYEDGHFKIYVNNRNYI